jgi:pantoate--beta-alanine ligase
MHVLHTAADLAPHAGGVFVPTMGALHAGHASLISMAAEIARRDRRPVIVSVFVNPTQFNDPADFSRYPKTLEADVALCARAGASAVFAPSPEVIYPAGRTIPVPALPPVATEPHLEDGFRPGHFAGVCQVVARLFDLVRPHAALFGEKDWQQFQVLSAMTRAIAPHIQIIPGPTIREPDGLAMSSRNVFLKPHERQAALAISRSLREINQLHNIVGSLRDRIAQAEQHMRTTIENAGLRVDYAVVRHAQTLLPVANEGTRGILRALIAARIGQVRLIDNDSWNPSR